MKDFEPKKPAGRRSAGRPRSLTLEAIVDAACRIDANDLCMSAVAKALNVGVATLYGYVEGIEQLVELVSRRKGRLQPMYDEGQSWDELLRDHAAQSYKTLMAWPDTVVQVMYRGGFTESEADYMENFLSLLCSRGVGAADALSLYHETNQLVLGAVVTSTYSRSLAEAGKSQENLLQQFLQKFEAGEYPMIRQALAIDPGAGALADYGNALERLIAEYAEASSDTHPPIDEVIRAGR